MTTITCNSCNLSLSQQEFPEPCSLQRCFHTYCWACFNDYVFPKASETEIHCPATYCSSVFTFSDFLFVANNHRRQFQGLKLCKFCNTERPVTKFPSPEDENSGNCYNCLREEVACTICFTNFPRGTFPKITAECNHPRDTHVCTDCLARYLEHQQSSTTPPFTCPIDDCRRQLSHHDVERFASHIVFDKYDLGLLRDVLKAIPGIVICQSPAVCIWGDVPCPGTAVIRCMRCDEITCISCNAAHDGVTCEQYHKGMTFVEAKQEENQKSEVWINTNTKRCPGAACGRVVIRESGCDYIRCKSTYLI